MKRVQCMLRTALTYRRESFCEGFEKAGFKITQHIPDPRKDDILCIWNRYGQYDAEAKRFERAGARVVIVENGYVRETKHGAFALAQNHHSGAGTWNVGGPDRWQSLAIDLRPWHREDQGSEIVIFAQRAIGELGIAAPRLWAEHVQAKIGGRIREHPGRLLGKQPIPLEEDLRNAAAVVTWHSAAALHALILGIPVYCAFPKWIGMQAAVPFEEYGKTPPKRSDADRLAMFERLAWAQWGLDEIRSGEAFKWLLC